jgi:hypothetical protein
MSIGREPMRPILLAGLFAAAVSIASPAGADEPLTAGLKPGQRPMPYAFVLATGPQRGQSFCYICDTADKPAAIVFARRLSDPLGKLTAKLDQAVADARVPEFRAWLTLLTAGPQPATESKLAEWGRQHALGHTPLGVFEDETGPPAYRLSRRAEVTVLLFVKQKVVASFAFQSGELTDERIAEVVKALDQLKQ